MRRTSAFLPATLLCLVATPGLTAPGQAIPCAPPLDRPLRLIVTQYMWLADGRPATATVTRDLHFFRDAQGLAVEASIAALETDQQGAKGQSEPDARGRMVLAYGAPGTVRIRVRLDPDMAIRDVESLALVWRDFRDRQARLNSAMMRGGRPNPRTAAMLHSLDVMGDAEKVAILTAFLGPVLRHCGTVAPPGAAMGADGVLTIDSRADSGGAADVGTYGVDGRTGLLRRLDRRITLANAPLRPLREAWALEEK